MTIYGKAGSHQGVSRNHQRYETGMQALRAERRKWDGPNGWQVKANPVAIPGTKYGNYLEQHHDIVFVPMAFESMGATGRTFTTFLRLVSEQVYKNNKRAQADFRAKWRRKIGLALHNTVAKQIPYFSCGAYDRTRWTWLYGLHVAPIDSNAIGTIVLYCSGACFKK